MIYMAGDSSLSSVVDGNLEEISSAGSSDGLDIVVLADKDGEGDSHLYEVGQNQLNEQPIGNIWLKRPDEIYTGRYETLESFVNWSMKSHASNHYLLVIWGHGAGWKGAAEDKGDFLNLTEMRLALADKQIDIIGFDACIMGAIEVYYGLEWNADYVVASEKKLPRAGWPYKTILGHMKGRSARDVGKMIVDEYVEGYSGGKRDGEGLSIEIALLKTKTGLCGTFKEFLESHPAIDISSPPRYESDELADLGKMINDPNITKALAKTVIEIKRWNNGNSTLDVNDASGMAIYCPEKDGDGAYHDLDFARFTGWDAFVC